MKERGSSQGEEPPVWTFPLSQLPPRGASLIPMPFFCPAQLHGNLSCCFGCIRDLVSAFSWFSVKFVLHVDIFFYVFAGRGEFHVLSSTILIQKEYFSNINP